MRQHGVDRFTHIVVITDAQRDDIHLLRQLGQRVDRFAVRKALKPCLRFFRRAIVRQHATTAFEQMPCHRRAHHAETDKADGLDI